MYLLLSIPFFLPPTSFPLSLDFPIFIIIVIFSSCFLRYKAYILKYLTYICDTFLIFLLHHFTLSPILGLRSISICKRSIALFPSINLWFCSLFILCLTQMVDNIHIWYLSLCIEFTSPTIIFSRFILFPQMSQIYPYL